MDTKGKVLGYLIKSQGENISGEKIANELQLSRTAIWRAIHSLKEQGHYIASNGNKGYMYLQNDIISPEGIKFYLPDKLKNVDIIYYETINSTNKDAKIRAINGAKDKTIIIANNQTGGYGRFERKFYSIDKGGIYISIILKSGQSDKNTELITIKNAIALKRAIDKVANVDTKIKWVNDIYLNDKKIVGILTEGVLDYESGNISAIIVGTGINFSITQFPDELSNIAGSIFNVEKPQSIRNELIGEYLKEFFEIYNSKNTEDLIEEYKNASFVLGKNITFVKNNETIEAKAININNKGELVVELKSKEIISLFSGEISIKINL
jgi:BirA family biotin operon repressor/biotin-[acetyl-CoA-carboxylase] ligase